MAGVDEIGRRVVRNEVKKSGQDLSHKRLCRSMKDMNFYYDHNGQLLGDFKANLTAT